MCLLFYCWFTRSHNLMPRAIYKLFEANTNTCCKLCIWRKHFLSLQAELSLIITPQKFSTNALAFLIFKIKAIEANTIGLIYTALVGGFKGFTHCNIESCLRYSKDTYFLLPNNRREVIDYWFIYGRRTWGYNFTLFADT